MTKIRVILADDEPEAREGLRYLLEKEKDIEVVATCANGLQAIEAICTLRPDLMFLDIQMPGANGFEVLNSLETSQLPAVVFVTAYDQYAVKAFEFHALDYLLKPFTDERFKKALRFAREVVKGGQAASFSPKIAQMLHQVQQQQPTEPQLVPEAAGNQLVNNRLVVKSDGKVVFLPLVEISWVQAFDYYIRIHTAGKFHLVRDSMKHMETLLPPDRFVRIHKSSMVNVAFLRKLSPLPSGDWEATLTTGETLKVSRNYRDKIKGFLDGK